MKSTLVAVMLVVAGILLASGVCAAQETRVIDVTAKKYDFNPSPIRVKQGTKVQLKITASDHDHGFQIRRYPQEAKEGGAPGLVFSSQEGCYRIPKGQTVTVEFVAEKAGTYPFKCCVHCGWRHRSMKGELIVEP